MAEMHTYNKDDVAAVRHVVREIQTLARSGAILVEPQVQLPLSVADRAVERYAAFLAVKVANGELSSESRDRAVAKYAAHMRMTFRRRQGTG